METTQPTPHNHVWGRFRAEGDFDEIIQYTPLSKEEIKVIESDPDNNSICKNGEIRCIRCGASHHRNNVIKQPDWDEIKDHLQ